MAILLLLLDDDDVVVVSLTIISLSNLESNKLDNPKTEAHPNVVRLNAINGPKFSNTFP